ncbi:MAG: tRNA (guanosine(46)-N7)-methyltransferase TrmB [Spirochaetaceae bacterium]|nr:tRNA (guanosine(46)-N7)-methyltransferase TrmB [Spirochaetaceae bacterium]
MTDIEINFIKSYVLRTGRMSKLQKTALKLHSDKYCVPFDEEVLNYEVLFKNANPVIMEIGFGMGHATLEIAEANPDINYIGIEVHTPGIGKVLSEIESRKLTNLKLIQNDAVQIVRTMIKDLSLSGIHVFFPDPWPKKKHHKRRLIQEFFIKELLGKIKRNGYIYIVTDWEDYGEYILKVLNSFEELNNPYADFADKNDWRPKTSFEKKGLAKNHIIREIWFEKK